MNYKVPSDGCYTVSAFCPTCSSVMTAQINAPDTSYVKYIETKNARLREAVEWMIENEHLMILIDEPEQVAHFMSRARTALEGK